MEKKIVSNNTIKNLKDELAISKLVHLGDMLEYKYGIKNTPCYHVEESEFEIFIDEDYWEDHDLLNEESFEFSREELIEMNVEFSSHDIVKRAWSIIP